MINQLTLSPRNMLVINLIIAVLFAGTLGYVGWRWHGDWLISHQHLDSKPIDVQKDDGSSLVSAIPNAHIFGKSLKALGAVPVTNLQFKVTGIAKMDVGKLSKAYISLAGGPSKIFQVGDNLPYGVKVYDITPDAVILENDGHLEKLPLPREKLVFKERKANG